MPTEGSKSPRSGGSPQGQQVIGAKTKDDDDDFTADSPNTRDLERATGTPANATPTNKSVGSSSQRSPGSPKSGGPVGGSASNMRSQAGVKSKATDGTEGTEEEVVDYSASKVAYVLFYLLAFFAFFFGSNRFDVDNDGDFDPEDVQKYMVDHSLLKKSFKKVKKQKSNVGGSGHAIGAKGSMRSQSSRKKVKLADISGTYKDSGNKYFTITQDKGSPNVVLTYGRRTFDGIVTASKILVLTIGSKSFPGKIQADGNIEFQEKGVWKKQQAGVYDLWENPADDGHDQVRLVAGINGEEHQLMDFADTVAAGLDRFLIADCTDVTGTNKLQSEESRIYQEIVEEQHLPKFVIFECGAIFGLWFICAVVEWFRGSAPSIVDALSGLETVFPGWTMLQLTRDNCEDYRAQIWRWLSYQFSHKGIAHVGMNSIMIAVLGIPLEGSGGTWRLALMFNAGVLGGAICYMVGDAHRSVVGASGGVYTLFAMHFSDLILNWGQKKFRRPTLVFLLTLVAVDLASHFGSQASHTVSGTAHLGGFFTGLLLGTAIGKNYEVLFYEQVIQVICVVVYLGAGVFCIIWISLQHDGPRSVYESCGWCWVRQVLDGEFGPAACAKCGTEICKQYWERYCVNRGALCGGLLEVSASSCDAHDARWIYPNNAECSL